MVLTATHKYYGIHGRSMCLESYVVQNSQVKFIQEKWSLKEHHGFLWNITESHRRLRNPMDDYGMSWNIMESHKLTQITRLKNNKIPTREYYIQILHKRTRPKIGFNSI